MVTALPSTVPSSVTQRPRVAHTESPSSPSELWYFPVTPVLSSTGTAVALPVASVNTSAFVAVSSSARDPHAEHPVLLVVESHGVGERGECR